MSARSPFPPTAKVPLRMRIVVGWGAFFVFVIVGILLLWRADSAVPVLIDTVTR